MTGECTALVRRADWERWQRTARQARFLANYAAAYMAANGIALEIRQAQETAHKLVEETLKGGEVVRPDLAHNIRRISLAALRVDSTRRELHRLCKEARAYLRRRV